MKTTEWEFKFPKIGAIGCVSLLVGVKMGDAAMLLLRALMLLFTCLKSSRSSEKKKTWKTVEASYLSENHRVWLIYKALGLVLGSRFMFPVGVGVISCSRNPPTK